MVFDPLTGPKHISHEGAAIDASVSCENSAEQHCITEHPKPLQKNGPDYGMEKSHAIIDIPMNLEPDPHCMSEENITLIQ